jgi:hypothetical protein
MEKKSEFTGIGFWAAAVFLLCGLALAAFGISGLSNAEAIPNYSYNTDQHYIVPSETSVASFATRVDTRTITFDANGRCCF